MNKSINILLCEDLGPAQKAAAHILINMGPREQPKRRRRTVHYRMARQKKTDWL